MARPNEDWVSLGPLKGQNTTDNPLTLGPGWATATENVVLDPASAVAIKRLGSRPIAPDEAHPGSPDEVYLLAYHLEIGDDLEDAQLWAFALDAGSATGFGAFRKLSGAFSSLLFDTPGRVHRALSFNGKLFLGMETGAINRMYVVEGISLRFVGLDVSAAPTVANTGAGAYPATPRFYKVDWVYIVSGATVSRSELSPAVSFTPSGAGTAARVTKPTTSDHASHWRVWASADDVIYRKISGDIVVATTTFDDSVLPAAYTGDFPEPVGTFLPPPSVTRLITDGNRLILAGSGTSATSAGTGETAPRTNRVWYTPVLGSLDQGDDERIPDTGSQQNYLDLGHPPIADITELEGPMAGMIFVFAMRFMWRLVPTGDLVTPYLTYPITGVFGAGKKGSPAQATALGETETGQPAVYFLDESQGVYRVTESADIQYVSHNIQDEAAHFYNSFDHSMMIWSFPRWKQTWWFVPGFENDNIPPRIYVFHWEYGIANGNIISGGWVTWTHGGLPNVTSIALFNRTPGDAQVSGLELVPYACTNTLSPNLIWKFDPDASDTHFIDGDLTKPNNIYPYAGSVTAAAIVPTNGQSRTRVGSPTIIVRPLPVDLISITGGALNPSFNLRVTAIRDFGEAERFADVQGSPAGNATHVVRTVDGLLEGDVTALAIKVGDALPTESGWQIDMLTIPVSRQQPR